MNFDYQTLLFNFIFTEFIYMIVPIIITFACPHSQKQSKIFAIVNSIVIYIGFTILYSVLGIDKVANAATSCMFAFINYYILKKSSNLDCYEENIRKTKSSEIKIQKSDFILIVVSLLILIIISIFIVINMIHKYERKIEELQNNLDYVEWEKEIINNIRDGTYQSFEDYKLTKDK